MTRFSAGTIDALELLDAWNENDQARIKECLNGNLRALSEGCTTVAVQLRCTLPDPWGFTAIALRVRAGMPRRAGSKYARGVPRKHRYAARRVAWQVEFLGRELVATNLVRLHLAGNYAPTKVEAIDGRRQLIRLLRQHQLTELATA